MNKLTPREPTPEMVLVPRDASNAMLRPFVDLGLEHGEAWMAWQKALDAAPKVEAEPVAYRLRHEHGHWNTIDREELEKRQGSWVQDRWKLAEPLYAHPAAPQPAALPLTQP